MTRVRKTYPEVKHQQHPNSYTGLPFLSCVRKVGDIDVMVVMDNYDSKFYHWYNIDLLKDKLMSDFMEVAHLWLLTKPEVPLSFFISLNNLTETFCHVYQSVGVLTVTRIIGPNYFFEMELRDGQRPKRRRVKRA